MQQTKTEADKQQIRQSSMQSKIFLIDKKLKQCEQVEAVSKCCKDEDKPKDKTTSAGKDKVLVVDVVKDKVSDVVNEKRKIEFPKDKPNDMAAFADKDTTKQRRLM
ncbi:hypothetical protein Tco_0252252 [Tanacetum coccineum]